MKRFFAAVLLATSAVPRPALADVSNTAPIAGTRLDINTEGEVRRAPDIATLTVGVVTQASTAAGAMADNAKRMAATVSALRASGIADKDIRTASLNLQPQYRAGEDDRPPAITGYQASNQLTITFRDIKRVGPGLDTLIAQGINQISGPEFALEHPEQALNEARVEALHNARERADIYAGAAGLTVKRIVSIVETGGYPSPAPRVFMLASRAKAASDLQPGEEKIGVSLQVTFELQ